ncbi:MAG: transporter substrate-binding domain-containing protein [SAR324 cluster bacterium]|nr:transporter substrate-binding domain-containing protein [SAR324 cluster bacterium]
MFRLNALGISFIAWSAIVVLCASKGSAQEVSIAFPGNLPPWVMDNKEQGITLEIVRESFKMVGSTVKPSFLSLKALNQVIAPDLDAHAQVESLSLNGHYSKMFAEFQTSLISLKPNRIVIKSINDIKDKRIAAYQNASLLFGTVFQQMSQNNPHYRELANQEQQVVQLYDGLADLILLDRSIFLYFRRITAETNTSMSITFHQVPGLTAPSPVFLVFHDAKLREKFNVGLDLLKEVGEYNNIFYKYVR